LLPLRSPCCQQYCSTALLNSPSPPFATLAPAHLSHFSQANSAILNALLTLLNERLFDNGSERIEVPLLCLVSADG
jgi:hypothetical protein